MSTNPDVWDKFGDSFRGGSGKAFIIRFICLAIGLHRFTRSLSPNNTRVLRAHVGPAPARNGNALQIDGFMESQMRHVRQHRPSSVVPFPHEGTLVFVTPESILEDYVRFRVGSSDRELWLDLEDFARDFARV